MKIKSLKINGFGKLKNRNIDFQNGINIIYGENEAGKSTILKFIIGMFYGLSKNKNGQALPDIEKYEPWNNEDFSGKLSYNLDNNEEYEIYREFKKKNPKIFNKNLEDISKEFNIDKTKGNQFFYDQIGLEEEVFTSSIITKQAEVKLDEKTQNILIQKISNILGTGEDSASYTSIVSKLKKKINEEIGTANTKEKPINLIENKIKELQKQKDELQEYEENKFYIDNIINELKDYIQKEKVELEKLKIANISKEKLKEKENKININQGIMDNLQNDIDVLQKEKTNCNLNKNNKKLKNNFIIIFFLVIATVIAEIFIKNIILEILVPLIPIIYFIYVITKYIKQQNRLKNMKSKYKQVEEKINILEDNKNKQQEELEKVKTEYNNDLIKIKDESNIKNFDNILEKIDEKQNSINQKTLKLHTIEIDNNNIIPKLEKLVNAQEELEDLKEAQKELEEKRENIKLALEYLEIAYKKMKEEITPKFTEELSKTIEKISDGKYKNVRININGEIIVEQNTGDYINAENLSIGTIDQLYLSLRLATIKNISNENMPIILDEAFAYYDDNRLENMLKYLSEEYKNKQIIIFTCTKREIEILEKLTINNNLIKL